MTVMFANATWTMTKYVDFNEFEPSVASHRETNHLFFRAKQKTVFYVKRNTGLKKVKSKSLLYLIFSPDDLFNGQ